MEQAWTDEELEAPLDDATEASITRALAGVRGFEDDEVAISVEYVASSDLFLVVLRSGLRLAIPREDLQTIADATAEDAANVSLVGGGSALHWENLMEGFRVKGLADGLYGNERWMKELDERRRKNAAAALKRTA
jgi:hypothetical protein